MLSLESGSGSREVGRKMRGLGMHIPKRSGQLLPNKARQSKDRMLRGTSCVVLVKSLKYPKLQFSFL